jgi:hypothetical protein
MGLVIEPAASASVMWAMRASLASCVLRALYAHLRQGQRRHVSHSTVWFGIHTTGSKRPRHRQRHRPYLCHHLSVLRCPAGMPRA